MDEAAKVELPPALEGGEDHVVAPVDPALNQEWPPEDVLPPPPAKPGQCKCGRDATCLRPNLEPGVPKGTYLYKCDFCCFHNNAEHPCEFLPPSRPKYGQQAKKPTTPELARQRLARGKPRSPKRRQYQFNHQEVTGPPRTEFGAREARTDELVKRGQR